MKYKRVIASQPASLTHTLSTVSAQIEKLDPALFNHPTLCIAGIGASHEAAVVLAAELRTRGASAVCRRASEAMRDGVREAVMLLISVSGRSVEPLAILRNNDEAICISLTRAGDDPLAKEANAAMSFECGEDSTPSATGYTGSLAAGGLLAERFAAASGFGWAELPAMVSGVLRATEPRKDELAKHFSRARAVDCVGAHSAFGTACEAALLFREAVRLPASGYDTLYYLHGPMEAMDRETGLIVFGDGREIQIATDMAAAGCPVLLVTSEQVEENGRLKIIRVPSLCNGIARAILDILPAQILSAHMSDLAGLTDVRFRYRQTDTKAPAV